MTATIIPNTTTFGAMTNSMVGRTVSLNTVMLRLQEAVATASSGYDGIDGTQFEAPIPSASAPITISGNNNFMIQPDPDNPGAQGKAYVYAIGQLNTAWQTFWDSAQQYLSQLDNGGTFM